MVNANYAAGDAKHTDNLPKHLWFAKKYKVYPKLFVDTTKWQPLVPEPAQPPQSRGPRCLKKVVRSVILSRRIGSGFDAKIKGATLQKCKLPPETETEVANILKWEIKKPVSEESATAEDGPETADEEKECQQQAPGGGGDGGGGGTRQHKESPYLCFLEAVSGEEVDTDRDQASVLGGLQSWLGFAGSLGGADMANMASVGVDTSGIRRPWLRQAAAGDEGLNKKAEEHMARIAGEFCTWLRGLPGEDRAVNNITETHLRQLFDTGHGKAGAGAGAGDTALQEAGADTEGEGEEGRGSRAVTLEDMLGRVQGAVVAPDTEAGSAQHRRRQYGRWYLKPGRWERRLQGAGQGAGQQDSGAARLGVTEDARVDLTVAQLHSTKAFAAYLAMKKCKKPSFIKYIMDPHTTAVAE